MTLNKLLKRLLRLQKSGCGRMRVCVNKETLWDGNGAYTVCDLESADWEMVDFLDDDGFLQYDSRGHGKHLKLVVLSGETKRG